MALCSSGQRTVGLAVDTMRSGSRLPPSHLGRPLGRHTTGIFRLPPSAHPLVKLQLPVGVMRSSRVCVVCADVVLRTCRARVAAYSAPALPSAPPAPLLRFRTW